MAECGKKMAKKLLLKSGKSIWKCTYDAANKRIVGVGSFIRYYGITLYGMVQFDYYGDDMFSVRIFKSTAISIDHPSQNPKEFVKNEKFEEWKTDEFQFDSTTLEFRKSVSLWGFNAYRNYREYYSMKVYGFDLDPRIYNLVRKQIT